MHPFARIALFALAGLSLPLLTRGAAEFDPRSLKFEEKTGPASVEFHFRLTEPEAVEGVEASVAGQPLPVQYSPFAKAENGTTAVLFLIDKSDPKRAKAVEASKGLVQRLLEYADPRCTFAVYAFAANLEPLVEFGTAKEEVRAKLKPLRAVGLATELYRDSIEAIKVLKGVDAQRKALVLFSDGRAEDTSFNLDHTVAQAREAGVSIFGVGYAESPQLTIYLQSLRRLAEETGGEFVETEIGTKKEPPTFARDFFSSLTSGGTAVADLSGAHAGNAVDFSVKTRDSRVLKYTCTLATLHLEPPPPEPAPPPNPALPPATEGGPPATATPPPQPAPPPVATPAPEQPSTPPAPPPPEKYSADNPSKKSEGELPALQPESPKLSSRPWMLIFFGCVLALLLALAAIIFMTRRTLFPASAEETARPAYARLQILDADGAEHAMRTTAFRLGRGRDNDLVLHNDSISRHHAEIHRPRDGSFVITDLGAGNGIVVNGQQVQKATLQHEDVIELGEVRIRFLIA